jgi:adenylate cyclase
VIGDTVNCASRLEGLQKNRHQDMVRVLISGETMALLEALPPDAISQAWGSIQVKGRQEPLEVIEIKSTAL